MPRGSRKMTNGVITRNVQCPYCDRSYRGSIKMADGLIDRHVKVAHPEVYAPITAENSLSMLIETEEAHRKGNSKSRAVKESMEYIKKLRDLLE